MPDRNMCENLDLQDDVRLTDKENLSWYPSHMHSATLAIKKLVKDVDIILEVLDARIPISSSNRVFSDIFKHKIIIKLLNKSDLSDHAMNSLWLKHYNASSSNNSTNNSSIGNSTSVSNASAVNMQMKTEKPVIKAICTNYNDNKIKNKLIELTKKILSHKGNFHTPIRLMIVGLANVGKSSLINKLVGRKVSQVANLPALTRKIHKINIEHNGYHIILYDTPGIMLQRIPSVELQRKVALCGLISANAFDIEVLASYFIAHLIDASRVLHDQADDINSLQTKQFLISQKKIFNSLLHRYDILDVVDILSDADTAIIVEKVFHQIGKRLGAVNHHGAIDKRKCSFVIIKEFNLGKFGRASLESPDVSES